MNEGPDSKAYFETFIEKITIFHSATNYIETDHQPQVQANTAEEMLYRLAGLYNWYFEYADLSAAQGPHFVTKSNHWCDEETTCSRP